MQSSMSTESPLLQHKLDANDWNLSDEMSLHEYDLLSADDNVSDVFDAFFGWSDASLTARQQEANAIPTGPMSREVAVQASLPFAVNLTSNTVNDVVARHRFTCPCCNLSFRRHDSLTVHYRSHTGDRPFFCPETSCSQSFRSKTALQRHRMSHIRSKSFECDECKRRFKTKSDLSKHHKMHTSDKSFCCPHCQRAFRRKDNLLVHLLTHSNEKKFSCEHCGRRFRQRSGLAFHLRTYEKTEKPFQCELCDKAFALPQSLSKHVGIHEQSLTNQQ